MKMILDDGPNVDLMYGQGNGTGYWVNPHCPKQQEVEVADLPTAALAFRAWIDKHGLGSGNITPECGTVYDGGKAIARVSYNGRAWTPFPYGDPRYAEIKIA